jgi:hypothetical protein
MQKLVRFRSNNFNFAHHKRASLTVFTEAHDEVRADVVGGDVEVLDVDERRDCQHLEWVSGPNIIKLFGHYIGRFWPLFLPLFDRYLAIIWPLFLP